MTSNHFDLVVIGGGPSGYAAALTAAAADRSVALIERDRLGGTCLHRGCIPAKELLETATVSPDRISSRRIRDHHNGTDS
ncbi:MAG: FAD-dependent oxidoreductase [Candidatus Poriferisodalaceae bacterium]